MTQLRMNLPPEREYKWKGDIYFKSQGNRLMTSDGVEAGLWGKVLPPNVHPVRAWVGFNLVGDAGTAVTPVSRSFYRIRGALVPLANDIEKANAETAAEWTLDEMIAAFGHQDPFSSSNPSLETDFGFPNFQNDVVPLAQDYNFYERRGVLGLPRKAMFTDADLIVYVDAADKGSRGIDLSRHDVGMETAKLAFVAMTLDAPDTQTDWGNVLWGEQVSLQSLYNTVWDYFTTANATDTVNSSLQRWLTSSFVHAAGSYTDQNVSIWTDITMQCKVYEPVTQKYLSIP